MSKNKKTERELLEEISEKLDKLTLVSSMGTANKKERKIIAENSKLSKREIEKITGVDRKSL